MLENQKRLFDLPEDVVYLNCASQSPQLKQLTELGQKAIAGKARPWEHGVKQRMQNAERARTLFAALCGATADDITIIPSVSYAVTIAANNIAIKAGQNIVMVAEEFPSDVYPWREVASKYNAEISMVQRPTDFDWTKALLEAINSNTVVVSVPNNHWTDGGLINLEKISQKAQSVGAALVIDATQSLGAYPLDVKTIQPDFMVAACYKWLLGPYSVGFMYIHPRRQNGTPLEFGWLNRAGSDDYSKVAEYTDEYQNGARRFDMGERNDFVTVPLASLALEQILEWGVENIQAYTTHLTNTLADEAVKLGWEVAPPEQRVGHILGLRKKAINPAEVAQKLASQNIYLSVRGEVLRVSPHLYNTMEDIEKLLSALR
jgi:selenocysteine lyase/cysteine desulfurase